jgi:Fe-Mn family superoxide dismutase
MPFALPPLPYGKDALAPHMSAATLEFHHDKHHKAYVDQLNKLVEGTPFAKATLEEIIEDTFEDAGQKPVFNNAAQAWNHAFFWNCMTPPKDGSSGTAPHGALASAIEETFGGLDAFKAKFKDAALGQFGSGWAWLAIKDGKPVILKTPNATNPLALGHKALLACDVWEHAYYLDYQNRRGDMVTAFLDHLVNWDFVAVNLSEAGKGLADNGFMPLKREA